MVILFYHYYSRRRLTHQRTNLEKVLKEQKDVVDNTSSVTSSANLEFSDAVSSAVISADVLPNTYRSKNARVLPVPSNAYPDGSLGHPHQHRVRRSVRHLNVLRRHVFFAVALAANPLHAVMRLLNPHIHLSSTATATVA